MGIVHSTGKSGSAPNTPNPETRTEEEAQRLQRLNDTLTEVRQIVDQVLELPNADIRSLNWEEQQDLYIKTAPQLSWLSLEIKILRDLVAMLQPLDPEFPMPVLEDMYRKLVVANRHLGQIEEQHDSWYAQLDLESQVWIDQHKRPESLSSSLMSSGLLQPARKSNLAEETNGTGDA
jgi:hypothetical protein